MITNHQKNIATFIHLSTLAGFIFPFGNFIAPAILWSLNKEKSDFVDHHGKQAINFQLSCFLYRMLFGVITLITLCFGFINQFSGSNFNNPENILLHIKTPSPLLIIGLVLLGLLIFSVLLEIIYILLASIKARDGANYNYPLSINFMN